MIFPGIQGGPLMHVIAAKAVCFKEALTDEFKEYQKQVVNNAKKLAQEISERGMRIVSGGTDTHLMLVDLTQKGISGKAAEKALEKVGITVNKNTIPNETRSPFVASGIRIGTPAVTTRGMKEDEMVEIAEIISNVIDNTNEDSEVPDDIKNWALEKVKKLCERFPLYRNKISVE
jgi:glycine hydroxymethyltransferase